MFSDRACLEIGIRKAKDYYLVRNSDNRDKVTVQAAVEKTDGTISLKPVNRPGDELIVPAAGLRAGGYKDMLYQPIDVFEVISTANPEEAGLVIVTKVRDGRVELAPVDEPTRPYYATRLESLNKGRDELMDFVRLGPSGDKLRTAVPQAPRWSLPG